MIRRLWEKLLICLKIMIYLFLMIYMILFSLEVIRRARLRNLIVINHLLYHNFKNQRVLHNSTIKREWDNEIIFYVFYIFLINRITYQGNSSKGAFNLVANLMLGLSNNFFFNIINLPKFNQVVSMVLLIMVVFDFKFDLVKLFMQEGVIHILEDSILMVGQLLLMELLGLQLLSMVHIRLVMHIRLVRHIGLVKHMKLIRWVNCIRVGLIKLKQVKLIGQPYINYLLFYLLLDYLWLLMNDLSLDWIIFYSFLISINWYIF